MNDITLSAISLFSGAGMLDEGLRAGLRFMGISHRTILHVEREGYAASVLAARMEEGSVDAAPIWSDVCTFNAAAWHGRVDIIVAGFPCQDLSIAGRRVGLDGKRSGLFFEVVRIATDSGAECIFLENVAGIATATASVMDETESALEERAAARVVGELADLGWDSEWITLSASDVGASHGRARWFCLAWRMGSVGYSRLNAGNAKHRKQSQGAASWLGQSGQSYSEMGNAGLQHIDLLKWKDGAEYKGASQPVDDAQCAKRRTECLSGTSGIQGDDGERREKDSGPGISSEALANTESIGIESRSLQFGSQSEQPIIATGVGNMAYASSAGLQGRWLRGGANENGRKITNGSIGERRSLFAPGPNFAGWAGIIANSPWFAPALSIEQEQDAETSFSKIEPVLCGVVDGMASKLDFGNRAPRLKCCGNGVVPLCAATAFVILARRAGIFKGLK